MAFLEERPQEERAEPARGIRVASDGRVGPMATAGERETAREAAVGSWYHLHGQSLQGRACHGLACFVARHDAPERWARAADAPRIHCLGRCYAAPAVAGDAARPVAVAVAGDPVVLRHVGPAAAPTLAGYRAAGGYRALETALTTPPAHLIEALRRSGLRGRGGAAYPTGAKWQAVREQPGDTKYVVVNADEGDPGAYIDRFVIEDSPHTVLEAAAIAAHAVGAAAVHVYVRAEYPEAQARLAAALDEARRAGILGPGGLSPIDVRIDGGHGGYVCGEETALLNAIEGRRPEVRARPPYPAQAGLYRRPTLVNNVETLAAVPWIVERGADAYRARGFSHSRGTKVLSLNSLFDRPGLYEVEFGLPVRRIVEEIGGGLRSGRLGGVIIGGPLAGVIPPALLDTPLGFEELHAIGDGVGHGGVVAFDDRTSVADLVREVFAFGADESCGKCTPCRLGTRRIAGMFADPARRAPGRREEWRDLIAALSAASLCGHGSGLAEFAASLERHYPREVASWFG
jgi:formate dehydrogenase iron-sulfur subunit